MKALQVTLLTAGVLGALAPPASAGWTWHFMPTVGVTFGADTNLIDLEDTAGHRKISWGGAVAVLGSGIVGIEADIAYIPGFFERADQTLVVDSSATTAMANLVIAAPLKLTGYSLRPYAVGGVGVIQTRLKDAFDVFRSTRNLVGIDLGGGAMGFFTDRTGVRFDLRYFRKVAGGEDPAGIAFGSPRLSFWRLSVAVVFRG